MFNLGIQELIVILIIALVIFGPGKLPDVGKALGKGIQEFRRAASGEMKEDSQHPDTENAKPAQQRSESEKK